MKMTRATFRLQRLKERERWKVHLWSQKFFIAPIKVNKFNIGTNENPKMASIGDYWDEQTVERIT